jgi:antitoxin HicB
MKKQEVEKLVKYYMELPYTIQLVPYKDGGFFVCVKELEGCMTEADTIEEAYEMIKDAMVAWLEAAIEEGQKIPLPEGLEEKKYNGRILLRLPKSLHKKLAENAKKEGVSLNQYIVHLLSERNAQREILNDVLSIVKEVKTEDDEFMEETQPYQYSYKMSFTKSMMKRKRAIWRVQ